MGGELKDVSEMTDTEKAIEVELEAKRRSQNCMIEIKNSLIRWNCYIDPLIQLSGEDIKASYRVIPKKVIAPQ